jgi:hypothetical protein
VIGPIIEEIVDSIIIEGVPAKERGSNPPKRRWGLWLAGVTLMTLIGLALSYVWP